MKTYRGVVIGCGKIGATFEFDCPSERKPGSHAAALKANSRIELVGLVDSDAAILEQVTKYYGVPGYNDARACLEELKPDIVVIATPSSTHEELLSLVLAAKVPAVLCEKPIADSLAAAMRMKEEVGHSSSIVILNHQRRFLPLFEEARTRIGAGELGRIQQVSCYYGNGLMNNGTHTVDALRFLLDDEVAWVIGVTNEGNTVSGGGPNIDGLLGFSKGTIVSLHSLDNGAYTAHDFELRGTEGALLVRDFGFRFDYVPVREGSLPGVRELDWKAGETKIDRRSMIAGTLEHVIACLDGSASPQGTAEDGYRAFAVVDALMRSAADGSRKIAL